MIRHLFCLAVALVPVTFSLHTTEAQTLRLFDLKQQQELKGSRAIQALSGVRIILVGEQHDNPSHHQAQFTVIRALQQAGHKPVAALEMFRIDGQANLDRWIAGEIDEERFKAIFRDHWGDSWDLYAPIFLYARKNRIPMVGLNVSRSITSQVAYNGFASLKEEQRGKLKGITCDVTQSYRDFIRHAYGGHDHDNLSFERFCEAQLVWDTAMAIHANTYAGNNPEHIVVILAGSGHARKHGIPAQLKKINAPDVAVILPQTPGVYEVASMTTKEADYIFIFD
jgi:uncharacterized iron-regulated protein